MTVQEFQARMIELEQWVKEAQERINEATKEKRLREKQMMELKEQLLESLLATNGKKK